MIPFKRQLEHIMAQAYKRKEPSVMYNELFPINTEVGEGAESFTYRVYEDEGIAEFLSSYAKDEFPAVGTIGKEVTAPVRHIGAQYGFSEQDLRASKMAGSKISASHALAARRSHEIKKDQVAFFGDKERGVVGVLTQANIPESNTTNGAWDASGKTAEQILEDLNSMLEAMTDDTNGKEVPNRLVLPPKALSIMKNTKLADSDSTVYKFFTDNNPEIKVYSSHLLKGVTEVPSGTVSATNVALLYSYDPSALEYVIPMPFKQHPPQKEGLQYTVYTEERLGGMKIERPLSIHIMKGL
jgi:hypothetical protein